MIGVSCWTHDSEVGCCILERTDGRDYWENSGERWRRPRGQGLGIWKVLFDVRGDCLCGWGDCCHEFQDWIARDDGMWSGRLCFSREFERRMGMGIVGCEVGRMVREELELVGGRRGM